jgi:hypothetical protein
VFVITAQRAIWNQPFSLRMTCHVNTNRRSRLYTNLRGEQIYENDVIKINTTPKHIIPSDGDNVFKYYLANSSNEQISSIAYFTGNTLQTATITATTYAEDYRFNIEIYRDNTLYNYNPFESEVNFESFRFIPEIPWINIENAIDASGDTYTYFTTVSGRDEDFINILILSGFSFDIPDDNLELKGFKFKITRSGFYEQDIGYIKDKLVAINDNEIDSFYFVVGDKNNKNLDEYSKPISESVEVIDYGQYEDFFGFVPKNWNIDKVNNDFRLIYQPAVTKSIRLSGSLDIIGKIYNIEGRAFYQTKPIWNNGIWENGVWINGFFRNGKMLNVNWIDGEFSGTLNYSP